MSNTIIIISRMCLMCSETQFSQGSQLGFIVPSFGRLWKMLFQMV